MNRFILSLPLLLGACGTLPEPFYGNPGAAGARLATPPAPVLIIPAPAGAGLGSAAAALFAGDLASALNGLDVPSLARRPGRAEWLLTTTASNAGGTVTPAYAITGPDGKTYGTQTGAPADSAAWAAGDPDVLNQQARADAPALARKLAAVNAQVQQNNPNSLENRPPRVFFSGVSGAPGDGDSALAAAMRRDLPSHGSTLVGGSQSADFTVTGLVKAQPDQNNQLLVELDWVVKDAGQRQIGQVTQLHDLSPADIQPYWGDVAAAAATEAAAGVNDVISNARLHKAAEKLALASGAPDESDAGLQIPPVFGLPAPGASAAEMRAAFQEAPVQPLPSRAAPVLLAQAAPAQPAAVQPAAGQPVAKAAPVLVAQAAPVSVPQVAPVTVAPAAPLTVAPAAPVTVAPAAPVVVAQAAPVVVAQAAPVVVAQAAPVAAAPEIARPAPAAAPIAKPAPAPVQLAQAAPPATPLAPTQVAATPVAATPVMAAQVLAAQDQPVRDGLFADAAPVPSVAAMDALLAAAAPAAAQSAFNRLGGISPRLAEAFSGGAAPATRPAGPPAGIAPGPLLALATTAPAAVQIAAPAAAAAAPPARLQLAALAGAPQHTAAHAHLPAAPVRLAEAKAPQTMPATASDSMINLVYLEPAGTARKPATLIRRAAFHPAAARHHLETARIAAAEPAAAQPMVAAPMAPQPVLLAQAAPPRNPGAIIEASTDVLER
jgi:hypothetical protein